jgi:hypothetical protein
MKRSIIGQYALPFVQWFAMMVIIAIAIDYLLHRYDLVYIGRYLGYIGTFVIVISFIYSLRKRKIITKGSPKDLLALHEYMAWTGSIMILVHAGIHFNAILPWVAVLMLLIAVASGLIGKFVLKKASQKHKENLQALLKSGMDKGEADRKLFFDAITVDMMKKWRKVHLPITIVLGILALLHILTVLMFTR